MPNKSAIFIVFTLCFAGIIQQANAVNVDRFPQLQLLIEQLQEQHNFSREKLYNIFEQAEINQDILDLINKPGESRPWYRYREQFVTAPHARRGSRYWQRNQKVLVRAQKRFGVDPAVIVAIIGVESRYGRSAGRIRTLDALTTLALKYPRRSQFFLKELKHFLLLTREQNLDPLKVQGSYAGAIGAAQFIPSSYRHYAVDFDGNGQVDIITSSTDAIGSVANYFMKHGWRTGEPVATKATVNGSMYTWLQDLGTLPMLTLRQLVNYGITAQNGDEYEDRRAALITLEGEDGPLYHLSFDNFFVITRYNNSNKYAMAVYELSEMIRKHYRDDNS